MDDIEPKRVLVAEDQALVAMLIESELSDMGYAVVGPFDTCEEASTWLKTETPDLAVLDLHLKDGPCTDVAVTLVERGVPFVALTGSDRVDLPDVLQNVPFIEKPSDLAKLPRILEELIRNKSQAASSCPNAATTASTE